MDINYLKALDKLSFSKAEIERLWEEAQKQGKSFEDKQAYNILENIIGEMEAAVDRLKRYSLPTIEGKLREMDNGKFELLDDSGKYITYFSCGSMIECYCYDEYEEENRWFSGRVEYKSENDQRGYYFSGADRPFLYTGMRARIRRLPE